jgi:hypothetical protein
VGPVAAGGAAHVATVVVHHGHREPVDLRLDHDRRLAPETLDHPRVPGIEIRLVERVVERQEAIGVRHRCEQLARRGADTLGRRVGGDELGKARLERLQLAHELVVASVRDLGLADHVVAVAVVLELGA